MTENYCSIIIPAYNCAETIAEAVNSALNQTYGTFEILIINDCSTDHTADIIQKFSENNNQVHVVNNQKNVGVAKARNQGLELAKGDYIAFLDSDDIWNPDKLERQIRTMKDTKCDFCYTSYSYINQDGSEIGKPRIVPISCTYTDILKENFICCSSVIMKSNLKKFKMDGRYFHEDFVYWLELLKNGSRAAGCVEPLAKYRVSPKGRSNNKLKAAKNRWLVYRKFCKMSLIASLYYFYIYSLRGFKKYHNL